MSPSRLKLIKKAIPFSTGTDMFWLTAYKTDDQIIRSVSVHSEVRDALRPEPEHCRLLAGFDLTEAT